MSLPSATAKRLPATRCALGVAVLASWLSVYQLTRDMEQRGIVEVILDD